VTGLFVYGTLKEGYYNFRRVETLVTRISRGWYVLGGLYDLGPYPALDFTGTQKVRGELIESDRLDELLRATDEIEGREYERAAVEVIGEDGSRRQAWTYRYSGGTAHLPRLTSGEWKGPR
jgi:gamma-glutamylcyclotransferase (GGCT)/AIG2-like uncharacterized protein YtfP